MTMRPQIQFCILSTLCPPASRPAKRSDTLAVIHDAITRLTPLTRPLPLHIGVQWPSPGTLDRLASTNTRGLLRRDMCRRGSTDGSCHPTRLDLMIAQCCQPTQLVKEIASQPREDQGESQLGSRSGCSTGCDVLLVGRRVNLRTSCGRGATMCLEGTGVRG